MAVSTRATVVVADHSPSPNQEYIHESDDRITSLITLLLIMSTADPVDDRLFDLNTDDKRVAVDVVDRWKQIRADDVNSAARKLL